MKKTIFILTFFLIFWSCSSQVITVRNLDYNSELNYVFSRINPTNIFSVELYNGGLFVNVYQMSDSKATPQEDMEDFLSSYIISVSPDGDYYSWSRLYKIEGIYNPKILEIKESISPLFLIKIEHGNYKNRKIEVFEFEGLK